MGSKVKTDKQTLINELADAISSFNLAKVANLLSENGEFSIHNEKDEIVRANKVNFLNWLTKCFDEFLCVNGVGTQLDYSIVQCLHCITGNPIIILNNGSFPVFTRNQKDSEKSGLVIKHNEEQVSGIELCFLILKTDNPYIYEKKYLNPGH